MLLGPGSNFIFGSEWVSASTGPSRMSAHLYKNRFLGCNYDVYVAQSWAFTMQRRLKVSRHSCDDPRPFVRWRSDGEPELVDANGEVLESQQLDIPLGRGC